MSKDEALKMAIEQIKHLIEIYVPSPEWSGTAIQEDCYETINACKEALEQPAQEPVAYEPTSQEQSVMHKAMIRSSKLVYKAHPAPSWKGLSDDEIVKAFNIVDWMNEPIVEFARAIEQALKEKNT